MNFGRRSRAATARPAALVPRLWELLVPCRRSPRGRRVMLISSGTALWLGDTHCAQASALPDLDTFVSPRGERGGWGAVQVDREKAISVSAPGAAPAVWTFIMVGNKEKKWTSKDCLQLLQGTSALKGEPGHHIAVLTFVFGSLRWCYSKRNFWRDSHTDISKNLLMRNLSS